MQCRRTVATQLGIKHFALYKARRCCIQSYICATYICRFVLLGCRAHRQVHVDREVAGDRAAPGSPREPRGVAQQVGPVCQRRPAHPPAHRPVRQRASHLRRTGPRPRARLLPAKPATSGQAPPVGDGPLAQKKGTQAQIPDLHRRGQGAAGHIWEKPRC